MQNANKPRWQVLCEQVAVEQDQEKLLQLVRELHEALNAREVRLKGPLRASAAGNSKDVAASQDGQGRAQNS